MLFEQQSYTYDSNGNQLLTTRTTYVDGIPGTPVVTQQNTYDLRNQLIRTVTENGTIVENVYNGDGLRVEKIVGGASTRYLYEYQRVVLEKNSQGDVTGRNVYGTNLLMRTVGADAFFYTYNAHADVTALLSTSGTIIATYYFDAFGNILEQTGNAENSILFAGYQYDAETGMYYLNARMYDPVTARFMQEDTYTGQNNDPLSLNLYTYCHNEPLMYSDPTGHSRRGGNGRDVVKVPLVRFKRDKSIVETIIEEKEQQSKEDKRTHNRYDTIGSYLKSNPVFAEQDYVQLTMEQAGNMGADAYLAEMEKYMADYVRYKPGENFEEWKEKQIQPNMNFIPTDQFGKAAEIWEMKKDQKNYATQRLQSYSSIMPEASYTDYLEPNIELIAEVYAYTPMSIEEEDLFWDSLEWLGTPYPDEDEHAYTATKGVNADCSAFARALYKENGINISGSGDQGKPARSSAGMHNATTKTNATLVKNYEAKSNLSTYDKMILNHEKTAVVGMKITDNNYRTGDVFYYNLSSLNGEEVDHVGIYLGNDSNGQAVFIENANQVSNLSILGTDTEYGLKSGYSEGNGTKYDNRAYNVVGVVRYFP